MTTNEHLPSNLSRLPKTSTLVRVLAILLVLAIVFWAGTTVGYRKAEFSYRFSDNYFRTFGGRDRMPGGMMGLGGPDQLISGHGAVGRVLSAALPTLIVSDRDGTEKSIVVTNDTIIRSARSDIASTTIKNDDFIVVIGNPESDGRITAKLIRVMPAGMPNMMYVRSTSN